MAGANGLLVSIRAFSEINNHQQKKAYEEQAAILLTSKQISLVITGESNSFLSDTNRKKRTRNKWSYC